MLIETFICLFLYQSPNNNSRSLTYKNVDLILVNLMSLMGNPEIIDFFTCYPYILSNSHNNQKNSGYKS